MDFPYVDIHTHKNHDREGIITIRSALYGRESVCASGLCACGVHPWDAETIDSEAVARFFAEAENCAAIGETGFDFANGRTAQQQQQKLFRLHLKLATERGLPLIVHCVKGYVELIGELNQSPLKPVAVIIHGFSGSAEQAVQLTTDNGFYLSYGKMLEISAKVRQALLVTPAEKLLFETDNSPATIESIYALAAEIRKTSVTELKETIYNNYKKIFCKNDE